MSEQNIASGAYISRPIGGIDIIPAEDIPAGYKRTMSETIFVNPCNYAYLRSLTAKGTIILLGFLTELPDRSEP